MPAANKAPSDVRTTRLSTTLIFFIKPPQFSATSSRGLKIARNLLPTLAGAMKPVNSQGVSCLLAAKLLSGKELERWIYALNLGV